MILGNDRWVMYPLESKSSVSCAISAGLVWVAALASVTGAGVVLTSIYHIATGMEDSLALWQIELDTAGPFKVE
jgi:hypothetical protein